MYLFENFTEDFVVRGHAFFFQLFVLLQQFFALTGQAGAFLAVGVHDILIEVFFGGFNLTPDAFVGHFHDLGGLVNGAGPFDICQNFRPAFADDNITSLINDPIA
jgi:hypothetical protein